MDRVYVLILNWNGWKDTVECLESVFRLNYPDFRVVVCDNGSSDGSLDRIREWAEGKLRHEANENHPLRHLTHPPAQKPIPYVLYDRQEAEQGGDADCDAPLVIVRNGANLGFAGGCNVGLRFALARSDFNYVWLLNNDTVVLPDALSHMVERMQESPEAGICGSTLLYYDDPDRVQALGGTSFNKWLGTTSHIGTFSHADASVDRRSVEEKMDYVVGASMLVSSALLRTVGLMQADYFLYYEELDWALRARGKFTLVYAPASIVYHKEGRSIGGSNRMMDKKSEVSDYFAIRSRLMATRRFHCRALPTVYLGLLASAANRVRRGQWNRLGMLLKLALHGGGTRTLKVLMISARADFGGGPEQMYQLIRSMPSYVQPYVACPQEEPYWRRYMDILGREKLVEIAHRRFSLKHLLRLRRFVRANNIEVIHSHGRGAGAYARPLSLLTGRPCIHTFHGIHTGAHSGIKWALYITSERILSLFSRIFIAVSEGEARQAAALGICSEKKIRVVHNGVSIPEHSNTCASRSGGRWSIVVMSRFNEQKHTELIIPIAQHLEERGRLEDFRFDILGTGESESSMKAEIARAGLADSIVLHGAVTNPEDHLAGALCCLSTSRWEGMPMGLLEAMAWGVPAVATDVVGNSDVVSHCETGFLYPESNPAQAAEFILTLADDQSVCARMSRAARAAVAEKYSARRTAENTALLYREAAGRPLPVPEPQDEVAP